jgi:acyl carrier protein
MDNFKFVTKLLKGENFLDQTPVPKFYIEEPESITLQSTLKEDLGLDSLDVVELVFAIEKILKIRLDDDVVDSFHTIGDIVTYLDSLKLENNPIRDLSTKVGDFEE